MNEHLTLKNYNYLTEESCVENNSSKQELTSPNAYAVIYVKDSYVESVMAHQLFKQEISSNIDKETYTQGD